mmetsp:Transcript_33750/g.82978  ORF Transcript_33750/g.82978 Transcript_33750/m.82978 type:complete len:277 (+) Transcript_33750:389-1219(+)
MPNLRPIALISLTIPGSPSGNFLRSSYQSPSEEVASSRSPNHPSSSTIISTPTLAATRASSSTLAWETSKYIASQVFRRTGGTVANQRSGIRNCLYRSWYVCDICSNPFPLHTSTHSGDSNASPGGRCHLNVCGLMPMLIRVLPVSATSASIMKLPEYTSDNAHTSPLVSSMSSRDVASAQKGLCWWLLVPLRDSVTNLPCTSCWVFMCLSLAQLPLRVIRFEPPIVWKSTVQDISRLRRVVRLALLWYFGISTFLSFGFLTMTRRVSALWSRNTE